MSKALAVTVGERIARFDGGAEAQDHRLGGLQFVGVALETNERLDARVQFGGVERLDEEVVAARLDALQTIGAIRLGGDDDDGYEARGARLLQLTADLEGIAAGS